MYQPVDMGEPDERYDADPVVKYADEAPHLTVQPTNYDVDG